MTTGEACPAWNRCSIRPGEKWVQNRVTGAGEGYRVRDASRWPQHASHGVDDGVAAEPAGVTRVAGGMLYAPSKLQPTGRLDELTGASHVVTEGTRPAHPAQPSDVHVGACASVVANLCRTAVWSSTLPTPTDTIGAAARRSSTAPAGTHVAGVALALVTPDATAVDVPATAGPLLTQP